MSFSRYVKRVDVFGTVWNWGLHITRKRLQWIISVAIGNWRYRDPFRSSSRKNNSVATLPVRSDDLPQTLPVTDHMPRHPLNYLTLKTKNNNNNINHKEETKWKILF